MMNLKEIDDYLLDLIVDEDGDQYPAPFRARCIREAVIAVSRRRTGLHRASINLPIEDGVVTLGADHESFVRVEGIVDNAADKRPCRTLNPISERAINDKNPCWRCETNDEPPTNFVHNPLDPYVIYVVGKVEPGQLLRVVVTEPIPFISGADLLDTSKSIPLKQTFLPDIAEYALRRLANRLDSAPQKLQQHQQAFEIGMDYKMRTDMFQNPHEFIGGKE